MGDFRFEHNNFDLIRILAALQVAIVHAASHLGVERGPLLTVLGAFPGVPVFFFVSGFLVSASLERSRGLASYATKRALRIYPALWVCFGMGVATAWLWGGAAARWDEFLPWAFAQLTIGQFYNPDFLRGYGVGVLNGSLWTIPVELQFYLLLPFIYAILPRRATLALIAAILVLVAFNQALWTFRAGTETLPVKLFGVSVVPWLYMFLTGVVLQRNQDFVRRWLAGRFLLWFGVYVLAALALDRFGFPVRGNGINPLSATLLGLATIAAAYTRPIPHLLRGYDLSYGLYIYHMIVVNAMVHVGATGSPWTVSVAVALSMCLAYLSWTIVERPALALKPRASGHRGASLTAA